MKQIYIQKKQNQLLTLSDMEHETILGQPVAKANHYEVGKGADGSARIIKSQALCNYEKTFMRQCRIYKDRLIDGRFKLHIVVYYSNTQCDLDNSLKTVLDCLQQVKAIKNDNLCVAIDTTKRIDRVNPRVEFTIEEI